MKETAIRVALDSDYAILADIMFDAARNGSSAYTEAQREAWVPERRSGDAWSNRLDSQTIFIATKGALAVGFMSICDGGYVDFAYIRPRYQGHGIFRLLHEAVEKLARSKGETKLWTHASMMARPAFAAMDFEIVKKESVVIGNETLERFEMQKSL